MHLTKFQIRIIGCDQKEIYDTMIKDMPHEVIPTIYGGGNNVTEGTNYDNPHDR